MSIVKIPFFSQSESAEPLRSCIAHAAKEMGMSEHDVVLVMSYFLEELANRVSVGKVVRIPGFGIFAPKYFASSRTCAPRFSASRGFRLQTRWCAPSHEVGSKALRSHSRRAGDSTRKITPRVFTASKAMRKQIRRQILEG